MANLQSASWATVPHRHTLVHTLVYNPRGLCSERLVEQSVYQLWQHMMESRHGFTTLAGQNCIWLPEVEAKAQATLFDHLPWRLPTSRLCFGRYSEEAEAPVIQTRFVPTADLEQMLPRLLSHLGTNDTELNVDAGMAYSTQPPPHAEAPHMALSCNMPRGLAPSRSTIRS